jgi:predicted site-specific integrase-resolvase
VISPWPPPSPYLTPREAAAATGFAVSTLAHWRVAGKGRGYGPPYVKKHGRIRYPAQDLEAWMREGGLRHTTEEDSRCSL